jgi:hypothetical protein
MSYQLDRYKFRVVYHSPKSSIMNLSNHDTLKNAQIALEKVIAWGLEHHEDFEPEHYKVIELRPIPRKYKNNA